MYLLSLFVFMVLVIGFMAITGGGGLQGLVYFIDMPSVIILVLLIVPMLLNAGVLKDLNNAFRLGAKRKAQAERLELMRAVEAVSFTIKALWTAGIFSVLFQFSIAIMRNAPDAELAFLYTAVSLIPLSYTTFFVILLLPLRTRLNLQLNMLCEDNVKSDIVNNDTIKDSAIDAEIVKTDRISAGNGEMQVIEQKHEEFDGKRTK
ncbi:MAG: hypothetical protein HDR25_05405 [Lachnospiraceae bacterium]|nr:hypothetical protein [Lachnospiraceae bacterium]